MAQFVLHLGYPKTGTTYLQRKIFSQLPPEWIVVTPEFENCGINIKRLKHQLQEGAPPDSVVSRLADQNVLFSIEGFLFDALRYVENRQFSPKSWRKSLKGLRLLAGDRPDDAISIILYLRRQDELIHSLYAESKTFHFAQIESLNDIDKYITSVIDPRKNDHNPGYYYDFNNTIREIREIFVNVTINIRLYEDLRDKPEDEIAFWGELTGQPLEAIKSYENKRQVDSGEKEADHDNLRFRLNRIKQRYIPNWKLPNWLSQLSERQLSRITFSEREKITFPPDRRSDVLREFADSNRVCWTNHGLPPERLDSYLSPELSEASTQQASADKTNPAK